MFMADRRKVQRQITIDRELNEELKQRPEINVSGLCGVALRQYLEEIKKYE